MGGFGVMMANARAKGADLPPRSIRGCFSWAVTLAERALTKPAVRFEPQQIETLYAIGDQLAGESKLPVPTHDFFFAVTLVGALLKHADTTPGTDTATRVQCVIASLLPLVRVDLAREIEAERNRS